jgi:hypothetical protein
MRMRAVKGGTPVVRLRRMGRGPRDRDNRTLRMPGDAEKEVNR